MAFVDGSSTSSWTGFRIEATGATATVEVVPLQPGDGDRVPGTTVGLIVAVSNTAVTGCDAQIQVATDTGFSSIVAVSSPTGLPNGPANVTVSGLPVNTPLYWRARGAPAGTTDWGPWSASRQLLVDLDTGRGWTYVYENVGVNPATAYKGISEYATENVGIDPDLLYAGGRDYIFENVGVHVTLYAGGAGYVYEGDVSTNPPTPHVWFTWKPYGFVGDEIWAYGHGFGNPQSEYDGDLVLRLGPDYLEAGELLPAINEWYLQEALPDAYTEDRKIFPGTDVAEPIVNMQVEIIRWVVPSGALPEEATVDHVHVRTTQGLSNGVDWLMYPTIPVDAATAEFGMRTTTLARLVAPAVDPQGHPQTLMAYDTPAYVIDRGRAVARPTLVASAESFTTLGTWDTEEALAEALAVSLGATRRWLPDPDSLVAHPELGTGVLLWEPVVGTNTMSWRMEPDSAAFIDPTYEVDTRLGVSELPAMSFDGTSWAQLTANLPAGPTFTMALVAVLQAPPDGRGHLLSSFTSGAPDVGSTAFSLRLEGAALDLVAGGRLASNTVQRLSRRPVVVMLSVSPTVAYLSVLDLVPMTNTVRMPGLSVANTRVWMGRSDQLGSLMYPGAMDVLEVAYWDSALSLAKMADVMGKLDGIYGVTG